MKKGYHCPKCGNLEAIKLMVTTHKGKNLSLLLASQAVINKPLVRICCLACKHLGLAREFRNEKVKVAPAG